MAATTDVEICNAALGRLGVETITALSDSNPRARLCNLLYDKRRDALLRMHPWNFASKRSSLVVDATPPVHGYSKRFPVPTDCLHVRTVDTDYPWEVETGFILTDDPECLVKYTMKVTDVTKFDPCFSEMLAIDLAHEMCMPLTGSATRKESLKDDLKRALQDARSMNAFEKSAPIVIADKWLNARY